MQISRLGVLLSLLLLGPMGLARDHLLADQLCQDPDYFCIVIKKGDTWKKLWPDPYQREIVKRVNRMNVRLRINMRIAVPHRLEQLSVLDVSPFPERIDPHHEKVLIFDPDLLAWAAYDAKGKQLWWGAGSGGRGWCPDTGKACVTDAGVFRMYHKRGEQCVSNKYPLDRSKPRAKIPYCMFFNGGIAFHGSAVVPGYHASHGCVRIFTHDARWLHEEFIELRAKRDGGGTKVIVKPSLL